MAKINTLELRLRDFSMADIEPDDYGNVMMNLNLEDREGNEYYGFLRFNAKNQSRKEEDLAGLMNVLAEYLVQERGETGDGRLKVKVEKYPGSYESECQIIEGSDREGNVTPLRSAGGSEEERAPSPAHPAGSARRPSPQPTSETSSSQVAPPSTPSSSKDAEIRKAVAYKGLIALAAAAVEVGGVASYTLEEAHAWVWENVKDETERLAP